MMQVGACDERIATTDFIRIIVKELGITEEGVNELKHAAADSAARSQYETAGLTIHIIDSLFALLELAKDST